MSRLIASWLRNELPLWLAVACCVVVATATVRREVSGNGKTPLSPSVADVSSFDSLVAAGHRIGGESARVVILEFADFECPACAVFARKTWKAIQREFGDQVALVFHHWPLPYHSSALSAAIAAECAAVQDSFESAHEYLFENQRGLASLDLAEMADRIGLADPAAFESCTLDVMPRAAVERGIEAARAAGGRGTPTIVVNGKRYLHGADSTFLHNLVDSLLTVKRRGA